jgi:hypothetical protein
MLIQSLVDQPVTLPTTRYPESAGKSLLQGFNFIDVYLQFRKGGGSPLA